jgi:hypothetical protein
VPIGAWRDVERPTRSAWSEPEIVSLDPASEAAAIRALAELLAPLSGAHRPLTLATPVSPPCCGGVLEDRGPMQIGARHDFVSLHPSINVAGGGLSSRLWHETWHDSTIACGARSRNCRSHATNSEQPQRDSNPCLHLERVVS